MKERVEQIEEGVNSLKINEKQTLEYWEDIEDRCEQFQFKDHSEIMMFLNDAYTNMYQIAASYKAQNNTKMVSESFKPLIQIIYSITLSHNNLIKDNAEKISDFLKLAVQNMVDLELV